MLKNTFLIHKSTYLREINHLLLLLSNPQESHPTTARLSLFPQYFNALIFILKLFIITQEELRPITTENTRALKKKPL